VEISPELASGVILGLVFLASLGGGFYFSRIFRRKSLEKLKQLRSDWRRFVANRRTIEEDIENFSAEEPEPYQSRLKNLFTQLGRIDQQSKILENERIDLHQRASNLTKSSWRSILGAPFYWYFLHRDSSRVLHDLEQASQALSGISQVEKTLDRLSWDVAEQVRDTLEFQVKVSKSMDFLRQHNVQGEAFEAADRLEKQARSTLAQIPAYFSSEDEAEVLEKANTGSTALAHQTLESTRPVLIRLLAQVQEWEKGYKETTEKVSAMVRVLDNSEQTLITLPPSLKVPEYKTQFDQLKVISQSLQSTLAEIEIESMTLVAQEAVRTAQIAQDGGNQLKQARRELGILENLLDDLGNSYKQLSIQMAALAAKSVHPISWTQSLETLAELSRETGTLSADKTERTPEEVSQDLALATQIHTRQNSLERYCQQIEVTHQNLLDLLSGSTFKQLSDWLQEAMGVVEKAETYSAENWTRVHAINELSTEVKSLAEEAERLVLGNPSKPIPEADVNQCLEETCRFVESYQTLQKRIEDIKVRLADLHGIEELSQGRLESAQSSLNQIAFIVRSNQLLVEAASQEVNRYLDQIQKALEELTQPVHSGVEKKARQVASLNSKIEQSANQWVDRLEQDTREVIRSLSASLTELESIAPIDESPLEQAHRLLSSSTSSSVTDRLKKQRYALDEIVDELKKRSDFWQACQAATFALQDVQDPLLNVYQEALNHREQAQIALKEAEVWTRRKRSAWPPSASTLDAERQEMDQVEEEWTALKENRTRVVSLVGKLSNLGNRYQNLAEKINQIAKNVSQEQAQVEKLELEIYDMARYWKNLLDMYGDNPITFQEINDLLDSIDDEQSNIKREYRKGDLTYDQVLQALKDLHRKIRYYQVTVDEEHSLEYGGNVRSRR